MKNKKTYIPCVLIAIILVFSMLGTGICIISNKVILNENTCIKIIDEKDLTSKTRNYIEKTFNEKYNSTGIPPEVYMNSISQEWLDDIIKNRISNAFLYVKNQSEYSKDIDFDALDASITNFFENYADENGYIKDSSYNDKLKKEIDTAHKIINSSADIFKTDTLYDRGVFNQVRRYIGYLEKLTYLFVIADIICIIMLLLLCIKNIRDILYWLGISFIISGIIGLVPCVYITSSDYFDAFVIKQEQIFTAFTTFMYRITDSFTVFEIALLAFGVLEIIIHTIINRIKKYNS
ncbi:MAG: hypothetical protein K2G63_06285 [Oscillospiraceae bacterium]|nr:hypothetical protein [Oscillospiraceae bacterium]